MKVSNGLISKNNQNDTKKKLSVAGRITLLVVFVITIAFEKCVYFLLLEKPCKCPATEILYGFPCK